MARFVLRFQGYGPRPPSDVERIRALPDTTVLDESPRMLLVESDSGELVSLIEALDDWRLTPEAKIELKDPRPHPVPTEDD